jgi:hypothetical protein
VAQGVGLEFKPQYSKKERKKSPTLTENCKIPLIGGQSKIFKRTLTGQK